MSPSRTPRARRADASAIRAVPELGERQRSELVDQPGPVGVADSGDLDRSADLAEPVHRRGESRRRGRAIRARASPRAHACRAERASTAPRRASCIEVSISGFSWGHRGQMYPVPSHRQYVSPVWHERRTAPGARHVLAARGARFAGRAEPARARRHRAWGSFDEHAHPLVSKQPLAAYEDHAFAQEARELRSRTFVAHIRYASTGAIAPQNTHPFEQHGRLFAHNGVIEDLPALEHELGEDDVARARRDRLRALLRADHARDRAHRATSARDRQRRPMGRRRTCRCSR